MPVVTECDDSFLNDARGFPLSPGDVVGALDTASVGDIAEGCVGAGTGHEVLRLQGRYRHRVAIARRRGRSVYRRLLVCTTFGARANLTIAGVPVEREITDLMRSRVNALLAAETTTGRDGNVLHAIPLERTLEILGRAGRLAGERS